MKMGDLVGERYRLIKEIGRGGMCAVYLAEDLDQLPAGDVGRDAGRGGERNRGRGHRGDGERHVVDLHRRSRKGQNGDVFGAVQARVAGDAGAGDQKSENIVVHGVGEFGVFVRTEDVFKNQFVGIGKNIQFDHTGVERLASVGAGKYVEVGVARGTDLKTGIGGAVGTNAQLGITGSQHQAFFQAEGIVVGGKTKGSVGAVGAVDVRDRDGSQRR
mgnify:CR=1 FL=1